MAADSGTRQENAHDRFLGWRVVEKSKRNEIFDRFTFKLSNHGEKEKTIDKIGNNGVLMVERMFTSRGNTTDTAVVAASVPLRGRKFAFVSKCGRCRA